MGRAYRGAATVWLARRHQRIRAQPTAAASSAVGAPSSVQLFEKPRPSAPRALTVISLAERMAATIAALTFLYGLGMTLLTHHLAERMRSNPRIGQWLEKLAGVFLIGFGLKLAISK